MKNYLMGLAAGVAVFLGVMTCQGDQIPVASGLAAVSNATAVATGTAYGLTAKTDYTIVPYLSAAAAGTSNTVYGFDMQYGTNWTTDQPLTVTVANNGTTNVVHRVVFMSTNFLGASAIRLDSVVTTQTNLVTTGGIDIEPVR